MNIKCGIVGLPNVGKSTLFNALTQSGIAAENFPFCTIEPNVGMVNVPDPRLDKIAELIKPDKVVATNISFVDIAGLVKGAADGEGLGNQFLANIRETDAIVHVVRCFDSDDIVHVHNKVNPISDIEIINMELVLADLATVKKSLQKSERSAKSGNKTMQATCKCLKSYQNHLEQGLAVRTLEIDTNLSDDVTAEIKQLHLLTAKPVLYVANVAEDQLENNHYVSQVAKLAEQENAQHVVVCNKIEEELLELEAEDKLALLKEYGFAETGLNRVIQASYNLLNLQTFFKAGIQEVRAWSVKTRTSAVEAAGTIHTDFARGFIRAEVIAYKDFIAYGGNESKVKEAGKWRLEGKDYIVENGDIMHFRFNV